MITVWFKDPATGKLYRTTVLSLDQADATCAQALSKGVPIGYIQKDSVQHPVICRPTRTLISIQPERKNYGERSTSQGSK